MMIRANKKVTLERWEDVIRSEVKRRSLTNGTMVRWTGLSKQTIERLIDGTKTIGTLDTLNRILRALGMRVIVVSRGGVVTEVDISEEL